MAGAETKYDTWRPSNELWDDVHSHGIAADELFDDVVQDEPCHPIQRNFEYVRLPCDRLKPDEIDPGRLVGWCP